MPTGPTPFQARFVTATQQVLARVQEYRERFGDYWEPAPMIETLVAEGRGFYSSAAVAVS